ncbi:hypothetical protein C5167_033135 [Papaver somniferum]|uniref:Uncharacterized protein n=1 Tax=Papaver somniferum TaxID=3469 RepID=A0A4Y7K9I0_PAPSO|nr:hypothetical protein C5167_033135 [Papaver somniferum]
MERGRKGGVFVSEKEGNRRKIGNVSDRKSSGYHERQAINERRRRNPKATVIDALNRQPNDHEASGKPGHELSLQHVLHLLLQLQSMTEVVFNGSRCLGAVDKCGIVQAMGLKL